MDEQTSTANKGPKIWWSNGIFFVGVHVAAVVGMYFYPAWKVPRSTLLLFVLVWQLAEFGITIGYHRLYSHRAFRASFPVRAGLAILGAAGFQGSIKWWCLRHRLHHRFTDDPVHDPYAATRGLFYSHVGWIFYKPTYERLELVDRKDLDNDPVVRWQHRFYVPIALFCGFVFPTITGKLLWNDPWGSFVWGGLVSRLMIWHATFCVNSLAHWDGLQPYSDEDTSRGNLIIALLTCGEGNHNFHAFPHDYRSGPSKIDWDPSKWIISALYRVGLVDSLRRAKPEDMKDAQVYMEHKYSHGVPPPELEDDTFSGPCWTRAQLQIFLEEQSPSRSCVLVDGYVIDVTVYQKEHPGGAAVMQKYALRRGEEGELRDASWAFHGGLNNHSRSAQRKTRALRIAKLIAD